MICPAKSDAAAVCVTNVTAPPPAVFVRMPPVPGKVPALEMLPVVRLWPFRSSTAPAFTTSAEALGVEVMVFTVGAVVAR